MLNWNNVKECLNQVIEEINEAKPGENEGLIYGQEEAARAIIDRILDQNGAILADEVGLGKTRVALLIMEAVLRAGGTASAVIPRNIMPQWETEVKDFALDMKNSKIEKNVINLSVFNDVLKRGLDYPVNTNNNDKCCWTLISHDFGLIAPQAKKLHKYDFFGYMAYKRSSNNKSPGWKKYKRFLEENENIEQIERSVEFLNQNDTDNGNFLKNIECPLKSRAKDGKYEKEILQTFIKNTNETATARKMLGKLIGSIDFLVIDEAHKSKNEKTRLTTLVERMLNSNESKRLCLTATPVDMSIDNWIPLLDRCGNKLSDDEKGVLKNFSDCLNDANTYPENPEIIDKLIKISKRFTDCLNKYVVRRQRCNQKEYQNIIKYIDNVASAHPHRNIEPLYVDVSANRYWKKAIVCLEGASLSAKGSDAQSVEKLLRYRYPKGLMDVLDEYASKEITQDMSSKEKRRIFWERKAFQLTHEDGQTLQDHPKIVQTIKLIKEILKNHPNEKILIFGTYNDPLKALNNALNAEYFVDRLEKGLILQNDISKNLQLQDEYYKTYKKIFPVGSYSLNKASFVGRAIELHNKYENLQERLRTLMDKENLVDILDFQKERTQTKKIDFSFEKIRKSNESLYKNIIEQIRKDVLNKLLDEEKIVLLENRDYIMQLCREMAQMYLRDIKEANADGTSIDDDEITDKDIENYLKNEEESAMLSRFSRFMHGDTKWDTRRRVQRMFNTANSMPKILIAQSLVGREGLNLHKCCRHVILFHPEWNPGVVEQEIGRVDRIESLWNKLALEWIEKNKANPNTEQFPLINVYYIIFQGTYDQHQFNVLESRSKQMNAQLFGTLLENSAFEKVPEEIKEELVKAAPNFDPCKKDDKKVCVK